jgi:hypothetical protein
MMALAAYSAWQVSGDASWRNFAMIPKATGWWYRPDSGAMVWIVDALEMAPLVGPSWESWWNDWCIAQPGTLMLRWLIREMNRRLAGNSGRASADSSPTRPSQLAGAAKRRRG